jgi:hypothetical protein
MASLSTDFVLIRAENVNEIVSFLKSIRGPICFLPSNVLPMHVVSGGGVKRRREKFQYSVGEITKWLRS